MNDVDKSIEKYRQLILSANKTVNLVSRRSVDKLIPSLIEESLIPLSWDGCKLASPLLDVGTGAGFPGIPLKLVRPDLHVTLLDSNRNKILFVKSAIRHLSLADTDAIWQRCEDLAEEHEYRAYFKTVTARGAGDFATLSLSVAKLLAQGGEFVVWLSEPPPISNAIREYFNSPNILNPKEGLLLYNFVRNENGTIK